LGLKGLVVVVVVIPPFSMQLAESAKLQFSCRDYSDHLALVRAYEGWREAERDRAGYDYCWKKFLSAQTLKAIDSLRRQFLNILKDTSLVDENMTLCNKWSHDENLVQAVICAGLYPGVSSVVVSCFYSMFLVIPSLYLLFLNF
jgi:ATP-dependent RNA helicase DHX36